MRWVCSEVLPHVLCFDISKVDSDSDATNSVYYNDKCEHLEVTS